MWKCQWRYYPTPPHPTPAYRILICATVTSPLAKTCCFQHYIFLQHLGVQTRYIWYIRRSQSEPHRCQAGLEVSGGCRWNSSRTGWWNMGTGPVSFVGKALEVDIQFWEFGLNYNILQLYQNSTTNLFKKTLEISPVQTRSVTRCTKTWGTSAMPWFQHDDVTMISPEKIWFQHVPAGEVCGDAIFEIEGCPAPRTAWRICVFFWMAPGYGESGDINSRPSAGLTWEFVISRFWIWIFRSSFWGSNFKDCSLCSGCSMTWATQSGWTTLPWAFWTNPQRFLEHGETYKHGETILYTVIVIYIYTHTVYIYETKHLP